MLDYVIREGIFILRLILACVCGGIIGYERKNRGKGAGIRTHIIVALASALMMIVSKYGFVDIIAGVDGMRGADGARIAAQVVSGVGFLGAGMIYFNRNSVKGLTTAAGIWATSGVGLAIGAGMYAMGIASTVLILMMQIILHKNLKIMHMPNEDVLTVVVEDSRESIEYVNHILAEYDITVSNVSCRRKDGQKIELEFNVNVPADLDFNSIIMLFYDNKYISSISL